MSTPSVRTTKPASELKVGDWIRMGGEAAELLLAEPFTDHDGPRVHLAYRFVGGILRSHRPAPGDGIVIVPSNELAQEQAAAERAKKIADIRAYADWLEANPDVAMPYGLGGQADAGGSAIRCTAEDVATVRAFAAKFGARVIEADGQTRAEHKVGDVTYMLIAWHPNGRPAEPHPSWPTEQELKPWESLAPEADRIAESRKPIDPDSSMEAHYDAEADGQDPQCSAACRAQHANRDGWHLGDCPVFLSGKVQAAADPSGLDYSRGLVVENPHTCEYPATCVRNGPHLTPSEPR